MNYFNYRIFHDENNPLCGSLSHDPERHEELRGYEYDELENSLRLYYAGTLGNPPYSGGPVKVYRVTVSRANGVSITLETDMPRKEVSASLRRFTESLKAIKGRNPSFCLKVEECDR